MLAHGLAVLDFQDKDLVSSFVCQGHEADFKVMLG